MACKNLHGLRITKSKTKAMVVNTRNLDKTELDGEATDDLKDFMYLGTSARMVDLTGTYR